jgi:Carboxypeptidase regulatory-like domain
MRKSSQSETHPFAGIARYCSSLLVLFVIANWMSTLQAHAQYRASIQGVVTDSTGAIIPAATVTLTDTATNQIQTQKTNGSGVYSFNGLPPDIFSMRVEKDGFQAKQMDNVHLIPEQPNALNVTLDIGASNQTVTVSAAELPALDTETASIGGTVSSNEIQHLPSFGRDVFQLAQLAPGAFGDGAQASGGGTSSLPGSNRSGSQATDGIFTTENAPQIVANGGQNENNGISIDGISTVSAVWGGASVITPSEDSVDNVKIISNGYDAENGRFSGAQVQVTSKAGSNTVHGSLFFKMDRPGLNAYQRWNGASSVAPGTAKQRGLNRDEGRFNQFGGSVGGPIWKNKIFAFFAYETLRNGGVNTGTNWYETPQFLKEGPTGSIAAKLLTFPGEGASYSAILSQTCANIGLIEGTQCRTIPGQGLDIGSPLKSALGTHDPSFVSAATPGVGGGLDGIPDIAYVSTSNPTNTTESQYNGRLDANVSSKDRITFTIYWVPVSVTNYNGPIRPANFWHHEATNDAFAGLWNHVFSSSLLNEARVNAAGWRWNEISTNPQAPFGLPTDNLGLPNVGPQIGTINTFSSNFTFQPFGAPGPGVFNQWTYGYQDILTKVLGNHQLKFGGQVTRLYYLSEAAYAARPSYNFANLWDFLNDAPYSESGTFNPLNGQVTTNRQDNRSTLWAFFAQDNYKIKPNLTLNLGLRWSYFGPMSDKNGRLSVLQLGSGTNTFTGMRLRIGGNLYNAQKWNFGPQVGFAWSPNSYQGKLVVRGGFGLNYNQEEIAIASNGINNPPNVINLNNLCCSTFAQPASPIVYGVPSDPHSFFGYPPNPNAISSFGPNNLPLKGSPIQVTGYPTNFPTQYTYHYSLDTQYDLGHQLVATLGYQGSTSRHLIQQYNSNVVYGPFGVPLNPIVQTVDFYGAAGNANYNALLAGLKHQFSHSFLLDAQYTWAKSMDDGSQPYYEDPYPFSPSRAWGRSDYYVGNAFKLYGLWQPTIFRGSHGWLEKVAGGWSLSGILNLHTGFPWTPVYSQGDLYYLGSNYGTLRPTAYLGGAGTDTSNSALKQGNPNKDFPLGPLAYFTAPAPPKVPAFPAVGVPPPLPGVARNSFNGPSYRDLDGTLTKAFGLPKMAVLGENARFEIRADAFNFFNTLNLKGGGASNQGSISDTVSASNKNFGQAAAALGSRTVELQARFSF